MSWVPGPRLRRGAMILAAWSLVGLYFFSQDLSKLWYWTGSSLQWWKSLAAWMFATWLLAAMTPLVLWLGRRWPLEGKGWPRRALSHVGVSLVLALLHVTITAAAAPALWPDPLAPPTYASAFGAVLVLSLHGNLLSYWTIVAIQRAWRIHLRAQEREKAGLRLASQAAELQARLTGAQLSTLKAQLQPHFLFNTLNAILVLVRQRRTETAEDTITQLGELLRLVLEDVDAHEVSVRRELELLRRYLAIEQVRFADRLRVELDFPAEVLPAAAPHLGLQPLLENALRHGISASAAAGFIRVRARRCAGPDGDELRFEIEDDGPGAPAALLGDGGAAVERNEPTAGIGLANTRARLRQLYGARAHLTLAARAGGGTVATMVVPFRLAAELPC